MISSGNHKSLKENLIPQDWNLINSPILPLFLTALIYFTFIMLCLERYNFDFSRFVWAGKLFVDPEHAPKNLFIRDDCGYDGQFYYRLSLDPFTCKQTDFGIKIDSPIYRQQRILYPLVIWSLSFGNHKLVPINMVLLNFIAICAMGWMGGRYLKENGLHAYFGVVFPLCSGFIFSLTRDLCEILEISLLMYAFLLFKRKKVFLSSLFLTLSILTKETAFIVVWAAFILYFINKLFQFRNNIKWFFPLIPGCVFVIWHAHLYWAWSGYNIIYDIKNNMGYPLVGFIKHFIFMNPAHYEGSPIYFFEMCLIILFSIVVVYSCFNSNVEILEKVSWFNYLIFVFCLTGSVWNWDSAYLRALSEFFLLGLIIIIDSKSWFKKPVMLVVCILWFVKAIWCLYFV